MAPESSEDKKFTEKSEVRSFAVCLTGIFQLGVPPHEAVNAVYCGQDIERKLPELQYCHPDMWVLDLTFLLSKIIKRSLDFFFRRV